jgi:hypothetical protein
LYEETKWEKLKDRRPTLYLIEILVQEESSVVGAVNNEI